MMFEVLTFWLFVFVFYKHVVLILPRLSIGKIVLGNIVLDKTVLLLLGLLALLS